MHSIHVPMDALQYTRDGLTTRAGLDLKVGHHNRVVIQPPQRQPSVEPTHGGFAVEDSFPAAGILRLLWRYVAPASIFAHGSKAQPTAPRGIFQVFAHADASGSEDGNKRLTDRRAQAVLSLLCSHVEAFAAVAQDEDWGAREHQAMLRILGCDPSRIDDDLGPMTQAAVGLFQRRYVAGDFHRWAPDAKPANPTLAADGDLGPQTRAALLEAFVVANGAHVDPTDLHPSHPANGCAAFNLASVDHGAANRRVSLIVHPTLPPYHQNAPCTVGDHQACAVVDDEPHRCLWFRTHVQETPPPPSPEFFDLRWLALPDGRYCLSALTTLADDEEVEFMVSGYGASAGPVVAAIAGIVAAGAYIAATILKDDALEILLTNSEWGATPYRAFDKPSWADAPLGTLRGDFVEQQRLLVRLIAQVSVSWASYPQALLGVEIQLALFTPSTTVRVVYTAEFSVGDPIEETFSFTRGALPRAMPGTMVVPPSRTMNDFTQPHTLVAVVHFRLMPGGDEDVIVFPLIQRGRDAPDVRRTNAS